jgi:hypothetical protein
MSSDLELFSWDRIEGGYEWIDSKAPAAYEQDRSLLGEERRFLVERRTGNPSYWRFNPIASDPTLYRAFARLDSTEDAYLQFANKQGLLGIGGLLVREQGTYASVSQTMGEPFYRWRLAQYRMRVVTDILDAIQANDTEQLRQWFRVTRQSVVFEREDAGKGRRMSVVTSPELNIREYLWKWASGVPENERLIRFARGHAQNEINEAMAGDKDEGESATLARIIYDGDREAMSLRVVPRNLLAALWLQCARVLTLNPAFHACEYCGKWFELSPAARRRQSKYCSARCKVAAYRARKDNNVIFAWMSPYYDAVRRRQDWAVLSIDERATALKAEIESNTDGRKTGLLAQMDEVGRWPLALAELEKSWEASHADCLTQKQVKRLK